MILDELREITEEQLWPVHAISLLAQPPLKAGAAEVFATYWVEAGHHIRKQLSDDQFLVRLLRHLLPPYTGPSVKLYRGENRARCERGRIGLAWTTHLESAVMFGKGLNAVEGGGVLLRGDFDEDGIISGPNAHSRYLGEDQFTVDPSAAISVVVVEAYPAVQ